MKNPLDSPSAQLDRVTWRQILIAARDLFLAKGYRGVSMKEIAEVVQVTPAALYYHFPGGKEELFTRMIQTLFVEEGIAGIGQTFGSTHGLRERLNLLTAALLTLPINEHFALLLRDAQEHIKDPQSQQIILSLRDRIKQQVMELFQAAQDAGEMRADIPVTMLVGLYMGMLRESKGLKGAQQAPYVTTVLLDGIASSAQRHRR